MDSDAYLTAAALTGGVVISVGAFLAAVVQIESAKSSHAADIATLSTRTSSISTEVQTLHVHFDANGGNLRRRIDTIEQRLSGLEMNGAAERAELRGLITDLRPILSDLRERS